ncbi:MAG TPA: NAD(P)-dependent oxidoreductase [Bellilinea sp.]|nr:NAD(P)-dependent oxidoreductase [Bellilinea sp.]
MAKVAWIGVGVMGASMAANLLKGGHEVVLFNRTRSKAEKVGEATGAKVAGSVKEAVKDAEFIFSIVGLPKDVEDIYFGAEGILQNAPKGSLAIDMTTSSPSLAEKIHAEGKKFGIGVLDAPVSGGDSGARNATLSVMVGGDEADFAKVRPLFECMGKNINWMGPAGCGQHTKAANQVALAGATAGYTEALVYSKSVGLDPERVLAAIGSGAAGSWQMTNMAPRVLRGDLAPGFFIRHYIKDMRIAREEMENRGVDLQMFDSVLKMYEQMAALGHEDDGTQALIRLYEEGSESHA